MQEARLDVHIVLSLIFVILMLEVEQLSPIAESQFHSTYLRSFHNRQEREAFVNYGRGPICISTEHGRIRLQTIDSVLTYNAMHTLGTVSSQYAIFLCSIKGTSDSC